ncbi:MAG: hypothetical protein DMG23_12830, partial [Acidobacteria bacterium]
MANSLLFAAALLAGVALKAGKPDATGKVPAQGEAARAQSIDFNRDIEPIFSASCNKCHGPEKPQAQLRLDSEAGVLRGGVSGKIVIPGNSRDSLLVKRLLGLTGATRMPMGADPLPAEQMDKIRAWIDRGPFTAVEAGASQASTVSPLQAAVESALFAGKIRPIFATRCYQCHGPDVQQNGLRLDSLATVLKGSASGKVVVPGNSEKSPMVRRLLALDRPQMPYGGPPLSTEEIELVRKWINQGAPGPDSAEAVLTGRPLKHWAY